MHTFIHYTIAVLLLFGQYRIWFCGKLDGLWWSAAAFVLVIVTGVDSASLTDCGTCDYSGYPG